MEWRLKKPVRLIAANAVADFLREHGVQVDGEALDFLEHMFRDNCGGYQYGREFYIEGTRYSKYVKISNHYEMLKGELRVRLYDERLDGIEADEVHSLNKAATEELNRRVNAATDGRIGLVPEDSQRYKQFDEGSDMFLKLEAAFPSAGSRQVVELEGNRYRKRFFPLDTSNSGKTVYGWGCYWEVAV